jgi:putative spermidine/putrescine transport system ATP-binding protein
VPGAWVTASIRPERIIVHEASNTARNAVPATVEDVIYFGDHLRVRCAIAGQAPILVKQPLAAGAPPAAGTRIRLEFPTDHLRVYS